MTVERLYLEDLSVGQRFVSGSHRMDEAAIKSFAAEFDPQPFHLDDQAARDTVFHQLVASGWHTAAVTMRLLVDGGLPFAAGIIGVGGELAWPRPTLPGDVLHAECEILEIVPSKSKPKQALVSVRIATLNQKGEEVYVFTAKVLAYKRAQG